ncbi:MAG: hypothetical protein QM571_02930 [Micrococcaceae bacterium]
MNSNSVIPMVAHVQSSVSASELDQQFEQSLENLDEAFEQLILVAKEMKTTRGFRELGFDSFEEWVKDRIDNLDSAVKKAYMRELLFVLVEELEISTYQTASMFGIHRQSVQYHLNKRKENHDKYLKNEDALELGDGADLDFGVKVDFSNLREARSNRIVKSLTKSQKNILKEFKKLRKVVPQTRAVRLALAVQAEDVQRQVETVQKQIEDLISELEEVEG